LNIDPDIAFADQGGDSLSGSVILSEVEHRFGVRVPVNALMDGGTVRTLSEYIHNAREKGFDYKFLVPIKTEGSKKPLICVHAGKGDAETYNQLAKEIDREFPVYAIRFNTKNYDWEHPITFEKMSKAYADEIIRYDPIGPYNLCGNCYGGVLAFSIAKELKSRGGRIGLLAMLDSTARDKSMLKKVTAGRIVRMFKRAIRTNIKTLKHIKIREFPYFVYRRLVGFATYFTDLIQGKLYFAGVSGNSRVLMELGGKAGPLKYSFVKYNPDFYDGRITFVFAAGNSDSKKIKYEYWKKMANEFELISLDCGHNDLVRHQNAGELAKKLCEILEREND
jgi:thioesterase domain-containing protein